MGKIFDKVAIKFLWICFHQVFFLYLSLADTGLGNNDQFDAKRFDGFPTISAVLRNTHTSLWQQHEGRKYRWDSNWSRVQWNDWSYISRDHQRITLSRRRRGWYETSGHVRETRSGWQQWARDGSLENRPQTSTTQSFVQGDVYIPGTCYIPYLSIWCIPLSCLVIFIKSRYLGCPLSTCRCHSISIGIQSPSQRYGQKGPWNDRMAVPRAQQFRTGGTSTLERYARIATNDSNPTLALALTSLKHTNAISTMINKMNIGKTMR